jgi:hypothetical protein
MFVFGTKSKSEKIRGKVEVKETSKLMLEVIGDKIAA